MKPTVTENAILSKIYRLCENSKNLMLGPGDDCAIIKIDKKKVLAITTDGLVEGTHFLTSRGNAKNLARKLIRSNLSDLTAMGNVKPLSAVCAAGFPPYITKKWADEFTGELFGEAEKFGFSICGGNIAKSDTLHLYLTVFGFASPCEIIKRSTARPADLIYSIGNMGHSKAGAEIIQTKSHKFEKLTKDFWQPEICLKEAKIITRNKLATSMIDNSDGLYRSVKQLASASKCRAEILITEKFISPLLEKYCRTYHKNAKDYVLYGGEDYGLVFTVKPENEKKLLKLLPKTIKLGVMTKGRGIGGYKKNKTYSHF